MNYDKIKGLEFESTCVNLKVYEIVRLQKGSKRADKRKVTRLVKKFLPDLYESLALKYYNPYTQYRTDTHIILVHSGIEYFLKIQWQE